MKSLEQYWYDNYEIMVDKARRLRAERAEARKWARKFYYQREDWKDSALFHLNNAEYWRDRAKAAEQRIKELEEQARLDEINPYK